MHLRVSRSSLNAADDVESHEHVFDVDARRTVVAVVDDIVRRRGYLPQIGLGASWTACDGPGGLAFAEVVQGGSGYGPIRALAHADTEIAAVTDVLYFEHAEEAGDRAMGHQCTPGWTSVAVVHPLGVRR